jgi:thioredoxin-like negative regulator of GroEL
MLGELEYRLGNLDAALDVAGQIKSRFPSDAAGHLLEGRVLVDQQRDGEAFRAYRAAYEITADWGTLQAAVFAARRAGIAEWESLLRNRLVAAPEDIGARLLLAEGMQSTGRSTEALTEYESVIRRDANNTVALNNAAWLAHQTRAPRALDYAGRARALAPDNAAILDTYGWLLTDSDRAAEGLGDLERAVELAPDALEIRYHLAVAQARTGRAAAARGTLEALLAETQGQSYEQAARDLLESL